MILDLGNGAPQLLGHKSDRINFSMEEIYLSGDYIYTGKEVGIKIRTTRVLGHGGLAWRPHLLVTSVRQIFLSCPPIIGKPKNQ